MNQQLPPVPPQEPSTERIVPLEFTPGRRHQSGSPRKPFPTRRLLFWSFLAGLAFLTWWVLTLKAVEIRTVPPADKLTLETNPLLGWQLAGRTLLRTGRYKLHATKTGYKPLEASIQVVAADNPPFSFNLEKLPGRLLIRAGEVRGVRVSIDGEDRGPLGVEPLELVAGSHTLELTAPAYLPFETDVDIQGEGREQTLTIQLIPRWARVSFRSRPAGATIRVDDRSVGRTPLDKEITAGAHALQLTMQGHEPYTGTFRVEPNRPLILKSIRLLPAHGRLVLTSAPAGATVSVDGQFKGRTPLTLALPPAVEHTVRLTKPGYGTAHQQVTLEPDEKQQLALKLPARLGEVKIDAEPADAVLLINGQPRGPARQTLSLPAVPQIIEIRAKQFETYKTTVTPRPGVPRTVHVKLKSLDPSDTTSLPPVIDMPRGPRLVLVKGGRFTMGAPRREPGRRANETLRTVQLVRPFYMSTTEITNKQFRFFKSSHLSGKIGSHSLERDDHPVVRVTWQEAALYCNWLSERASLPPAYEQSGSQVVPVHPESIGFRLPTEAEWAYAARIYPGRPPAKYPWGQSLPVPAGGGNYADASAADFLPGTRKDLHDGFPVTAPAESFKANPWGIYNLGGNVSEWIQDIYTIYPPSNGAVFKDPQGPSTGELHVIRGASWMDGSVSALRLSYRGYGNKARPEVGFRVARYAR